MFIRLPVLAAAFCVACGPNTSIDDGGDASSEPSDGGPWVAVPLSVCSPQVYAAPVNIGSSQQFQLLVDTGSTTLAVAGSGCTSCSGAGASPLYQPGATAVDEHTQASATYGALATSGWSGEIYEDRVAAGSSGAAASVRLVSIAQQSQFLVGSCGTPGRTPDGVLGLAPANSATAGTTGYLDAVIAAGDVPDVFALRLCPSGGTLWLGGYDPAATSAAPVYTPFFPPGFSAYVYTVQLQSITVAGTTIAIPTGVYTATLLDSGSNISSIPPSALTSLGAALDADSAFSQLFGGSAASFFSNPNNCVALTQTRDELDASLPSVTLSFGSTASANVTASATTSYLWSPSSGQWCPAITSRAPSPQFQSIAAILGAPFLASNVVIFDRAGQRIGFAPHSPCP
jgi:hypothetical protein